MRNASRYLQPIFFNCAYGLDIILKSFSLLFHIVKEVVVWFCNTMGVLCAQLVLNESVRNVADLFYVV